MEEEASKRDRVVSQNNQDIEEINELWSTFQLPIPIPPYKGRHTNDQQEWLLQVVDQLRLLQTMKEQYANSNNGTPYRSSMKHHRLMKGQINLAFSGQARIEQTFPSQPESMTDTTIADDGDKQQPIFYENAHRLVQNMREETEDICGKFHEWLSRHPEQEQQMKENVIANIFFAPLEPVVTQDEPLDDFSDEDDDVDEDNFDDEGDRNRRDESSLLTDKKSHPPTRKEYPTSSKQHRNEDIDPVEFQKQQQELLEEELSSMAERLKSSTLAMNATLQTQTKDLEGMEDIAQANLDNVSSTTKKVEQRLTKNKGWKKKLATWSVIFTVVGMWILCFMIMRTVPKRKMGNVRFVGWKNWKRFVAEKWKNRLDTLLHGKSSSHFDSKEQYKTAQEKFRRHQQRQQQRQQQREQQRQQNKQQKRQQQSNQHQECEILPDGTQQCRDRDYNNEPDAKAQQFLAERKRRRIEENMANARTVEAIDPAEEEAKLLKDAENKRLRREAAAKRKAEKEAAAAARQKAEEEAAAAATKKKVEEEAAAAARQKKAEEEAAAAARKLAEEEAAAAAAKRKAEEEAAAAARQKAEKEAAAAKKKAEGEAATAARNLAEEEAAAAAAAKRKAEEEAAEARKLAKRKAAAEARKRAEEEADIAKRKAAEEADIPDEVEVEENENTECIPSTSSMQSLQKALEGMANNRNQLTKFFESSGKGSDERQSFLLQNLQSLYSDYEKYATSLERAQVAARTEYWAGREQVAVQDISFCGADTADLEQNQNAWAAFSELIKAEEGRLQKAQEEAKLKKEAEDNRLRREAAAKRKAEEEAAAAARKKAEEEAATAARKKAEEAAVAAAKRKAEEEAAEAIVREQNRPAALHERIQIEVRKALEAAEQVESDGFKASDLRFAASRGQNDLLAYYISEMPAWIDASDAGGWRPLHEAARAGNLVGIELLISAGCDVSSRTGRSGNGGTALWWAIQRYGEKHDVVALLRFHNALEAGPAR